MPFPPELASSALYRVLAADPELLAALDNLRATAEHLAATIDRDAPSFTDHSIRHMDALWTITEKVLTESELTSLSTAEAFLLASGFYLHDIGMAYAATDEGRALLESSAEYIAAIGPTSQTAPEPQLRSRALSAAVRARHAQAATELAVRPIPGTSQFLLEPSSIREQFGPTCGRIAESHHWSVDRLDSELGTQGKVPLAGSRSADLGFVASALRLIDYAHINRERAPTLARKFRPELPADSAVHWDAQQDIDGPERAGDELVYRSGSDLQSVDAWWLYYEMMRGLDNEIRQVRSFLQKRSVSVGRLSLVGVKGSGSPADASKFIRTAGFLPLEVSVRTSSISRLVKILAGESLYGKNFMAPVRELVQNAVDAILLKKSVAKSEADRALAGLPVKLVLNTTSGVADFSIRDWGVGMSKKVIVDHLLTIASDYWESQYFTDYPGGAKNFTPTGRFGIGFLSVFMLGERVCVTSERSGDSRYRLNIRGLGRRAELRQETTQGYSGSEVTVTLSAAAAAGLKDLAEQCRSYFPLLPIPVEVLVGDKTVSLAPYWLLDESPEDLRRWVVQARSALQEGDDDGASDAQIHYAFPYVRHSRLPRSNEDSFWAKEAPEYTEDGVRLLADPAGFSVLCLRGFALQTVQTPGFTGVINSDTVTPDASRRRGIDIDLSPLLKRAREKIRPKVQDGLDALGAQGFSANRIDLLSWCCSTYGPEPILESSFRFIQIVELDGSSRYACARDFSQMVCEATSVFVALNVGPNGLLKAWHARSQEAKECKLGVCFTGHERIYPGYLSPDETKNESLRELWPDRDGAPLFGLFLQVLEQAWHSPPDTLVDQDGWVHKSNELCGYFRRT